jgi:hypothetical protein
LNKDIAHISAARTALQRHAAHNAARLQFSFRCPVLAGCRAHHHQDFAWLNGRHHESAQRHFFSGFDQTRNVEFAFRPVDLSRGLVVDPESGVGADALEINRDVAIVPVGGDFEAALIPRAGQLASVQTRPLRAFASLDHVLVAQPRSRHLNVAPAFSGATFACPLTFCAGENFHGPFRLMRARLVFSISTGSLPRELWRSWATAHRQTTQL